MLERPLDILAEDHLTMTLPPHFNPVRRALMLAGLGAACSSHALPARALELDRKSVV